MPPRDLYAMAKELNFTSKEFFDKYCEVFIGSDTRIPVVRLKPVGFRQKMPTAERSKMLRSSSKTDRLCIVSDWPFYAFRKV